ncbi:MAG: HemK2/MTQ2 family protein methyltransferase [Candidatus Thorarchaeota archaeon]
MDDDSFNITVFPGVYPPSEDTYLLLDAIDIRPDDVFLEIGCGAGLITLTAARSTRNIVSVDSSFEAVHNTMENLKRNDLYNNCHVVESDLLGAIAPSIKFSLIVFNPPYLPQDDEPTDLDHALVGGQKGTELTQRFIRQAADHLLRGGRVFVVVSNLANIDSIRTTMIECGFAVESVSSETLFFEKIQVLRGIL